MIFSRRILLTLSSNVVARKFCIIYWNQKINSKTMFSLNSKQFHFRFLITMLWFWTIINLNFWRLFLTNNIFEQKRSQTFHKIFFLKIDSNQSISWNCFEYTQLSKIKINISIKFDFDIFRAKHFHHKSFRMYRVEKINRFHYL